MHAILYETIIIYANHAKIKACGATYLLTPLPVAYPGFHFWGVSNNPQGLGDLGPLPPGKLLKMVISRSILVTLAL